MSSSIITVGLSMMLFVLVKSTKPCENYQAIDNPFRSTKYKLKKGDVAICDSNLPTDWYRFTSVVGGMMPETKPDPYYCGTVAPVWIKDTHPTKKGEVKDVNTCTNVMGANGGCSVAHSIRVKNCGNFFVYRLRQTYGCSMAYCAGDKVPCPEGQAGIFPNCTVLILADFPYNLIPKPYITYREYTTSFSMLCKFDQFPAWTNVSFAVEWFADNKLTKKETICGVRNTEQPKCKNRESNLTQVYFNPGQNVHCKIRMKYTTHPKNSWTKKWKNSNFYFIGLEISPKHVFVKKCEQNDVTVNIRPTVPLIAEWGRLPKWKLFVPSTEQTKDKETLIRTSCDLTFFKNHTKSGKQVTITGVCDDLKRNGRNYVDYQFVHKGLHPFWKYQPRTAFRVSIQETDLKYCRTYSEPRMVTFDSQYYSILNPTQGDYVLYKNVQRDIEIHTRHWDCFDYSCVCGVAISEGNDVFVFSICNEKLKYQLQPTLLHVRLRSCCPLARGTHIRKGIEGSYIKYSVILPSGTRLTVTRNHQHIDVHLYAPTDGNTVEGLCGNANGNSGDEFAIGRNGMNTQGRQDLFIESWRIKSKESLFDKKLPTKCKTNVETTFWCECQIDKGGSNSVECKDNANLAMKFPAKEIPIILVESQKCNTARKRRSTEKIIYSDDLTLDNDDANFFIDDVQVKFAVERIRARRSVSKNAMSAENATKYCKSILEETTAGKLCKAVPGLNLTSIERACISDLKLTGVLDFASAAFTVMKESCERDVLRNISLYKNNSNGELLPPMEIGDKLCPSDCSYRGNCTNRTCICDEGYTSEDCSMAINTVPELLGIYDGGLCDIRQRPCKKTDLFGQGFLNSENLTCHVKEVKIFSSKWIPKTHTIKLPGKMIDLFGVRCELPDPPTKLDDYVSGGTPASGLWISVSNDGEHKSQRQMRFISYDSTCIACNKTGNCTLKENTCLIRGHCFASTEWNPWDWCQLCIPNNSQHSWTRRKNNKAPSFEQGQSTRYAISGENLPLQLKATDPDKRPVTYSLISSTASSGYNFSSTGLLQWNVTSQEDFTVQVTDECNETDTITITIRIVKCQCKNGGLCFPHPYYPRGSGQYSCECPKGFSDDKCETNINDCVSVNCGNGTCIDGINNYTCRCNPGFKGSLCNQTIYKCTIQSCFTGVQCTEIASGISCGPCPVGMSGDGKYCSAPTSTSSPTTVPTTNAPTTTGSPTTAETTKAPTTTSSPTTVATTNAPTTTSSPTTAATTKAPTTTNSPTTVATTKEQTAKPTTVSTTRTEATTELIKPTLVESPSPLPTDEVTNPPRTTGEIEGDIVKAELSIKMEWENVYLEKESQEFKFLAQKLESDILDSYRNSGYYGLKKVKVISMRQGSIIVEFELVFDIKPSDPLEQLKKSIEDGKMGTFTVDPKSLKMKHEATDEPNLPAKKDLTLILILVGLGIVILLVATIVLVCKFQNRPLEKQMYRLRNRNRSGQLDENGKDILEMEAPREGPIQGKAAVDLESGSNNAGFQ